MLEVFGQFWSVALEELLQLTADSRSSLSLFPAPLVTNLQPLQRMLVRLRPIIVQNLDWMFRILPLVINQDRVVIVFLRRG